MKSSKIVGSCRIRKDTDSPKKKRVKNRPSSFDLEKCFLKPHSSKTQIALVTRPGGGRRRWTEAPRQADGCSCSCSRIPFLSLRSDELPGFDFFSFRIFLVIDKPQDVCIARIKLLHLGRQPSQTRHRRFITDRAVGFSVPRFLPVFCFRRRHRHGEIRRYRRR